MKLALEWEEERVKDSSTMKRWTEEEKAQKESESVPYKACRMELERNLETKAERVWRWWSGYQFQGASKMPAVHWSLQNWEALGRTVLDALSSQGRKTKVEKANSLSF